ncbi:hypothetical protein [Humisphaera borealis]|uniref:Uncharacterized protein n=1 Tax=Humisphaera borealis TaxID=2807512 RepID=A0A7M2WVF5_9BACT|nr:hypothetical protein [Humisphaera borealis]QOV89304.1 hypothetical protein IPV69_24365 [Humisphaera borealis]
MFRADPITSDNLRTELTSLADTYVTIALQGLEQLRGTTKRPEVIAWVAKDRVGVTLASFTNASNASAAAGLLDMIVYGALKRIAVEEHWGPKLLTDEAAPVLDAYRRGEAEVWAAARRNLSEAQVAQLRGLIDEWRKEHPTQFYVSHIRFSEFAKYRGVSADSPEAKIPGNVFGMLYMDPLAGIDPVVREAREFRMLAERASYVAMRMPYLLTCQLDLAALSLTGTPEMTQIARSTETFAQATAAFGRTTAELTANLGAERRAALDQTAEILSLERAATIDQIADHLQDQRKGIVTDLNQQEANLKGLLKEVGGLVTQADQTAKSVTAATSDTVARTQLAAQATTDRIFMWLIALTLLLLVGIPVSAFANRWARKRQSANELAAKA